MPNGPTDLQTLCEAVLDASVAALDTLPGFAGGLEGAPSRAYVTDGQPALNCPQLTVNAYTTRELATEPLGAGAGTRHKQDFRKNLVGVQVWIARCRALDTPLDPVRVQAVATQINADAWALWNYLWNINRQGSSDPLVTICDEFYMDSLTPLQPSGQYAGWVLQLRVELAGYGTGAAP